MVPSPEPHVLSTTAGDLRLAEYHLRIGEHAWRILHNGAILSRADEERFLGSEQHRRPYGIMLWPAAIALAHEVGARDFAGKRVLELGAGTGLPGIVAATLGARVVQTDGHDVSLFVCRKNAEHNGLTSVIEHRAADWGSWKDEAQYDCILASDVLYAPSLHSDLRHIFETNLVPGGRVLVSDPFREVSFELFEAMAAGGWKITVNKWTVGITPPERAVGVFELTRG